MGLCPNCFNRNKKDNPNLDANLFTNVDSFTKEIGVKGVADVWTYSPLLRML